MSGQINEGSGDVAVSRDPSESGAAIADIHPERPAVHRKRQSPINIDLEHTEEDHRLAKLLYTHCLDAGARLVNDGKAPTCYVTPATHLLSGGPLSEEYELVQYHIHFSGKSHGSEHAVDGVGHPAEIHFVHYKKEYGDFPSALQYPDGLAVVGAFIDVDDSNAALHHQLDADILKMVNITEFGATYPTSVDLTKYELSKCDRFFTYSGSLTTDPFHECVEWILLKDSIRVSNEAFQVLKQLQTATGSTIQEMGNSRAIQDRSGRKIRCNFASDKI